jgi:O-antigen biosynthesis protein
MKMTPATPSRSPMAQGADDSQASSKMIEVELTEPLPAISPDVPGGRLWVLARLASEPVGVCVLRPDTELTPGQFGELLWAELATPVTERFTAAGLAAPDGLPAEGLPAHPSLAPADITGTAPFISVVICTRDRPSQLEVCLGYLAQQDYPNFEVVVVNNVPRGDIVRKLVDARDGEPVTFRYVEEHRPGLSWARNTGVVTAAADLIAFLDDDDEPDSRWLAGIARGFARGSDVGCVSGMTLASRLETIAQELFEELGGHSTGRGFTPTIFTRKGPQDPLFPRPPFGAGANMAFRREALERIGGFDVALGAGTPTRMGEDTLAFTLVLLAGYSIAYEPSALMRHSHRRDMDGLREQLHGLNIGLLAYYTALLRHRPTVFPRLLRLLPLAAGYLRNGRSLSPPSAPVGLPPDLTRLNPRAVLSGPFLYISSVRRQARIAAEEQR